MTCIELKNVTYTYPLSKTPCVSHADLVIEKGKFYAVIGANGSGKTTLCNIIRGFIPEFYQGELEGSVILDGKNLNEYTLGELAQRLDMYSKIHLTRLREQGTMCMKRLRMVWRTSVYL